MRTPPIPVTSCLLLLLAVSGRAGDGAAYTPPVLDFVLDPGDVHVVDVTVTIPGQTTFDRIDLYFLADNTGSMTAIIQDVKDEVTTLATSVVGALGHPDLASGVGRYRDFPFNLFAFEHQLSPTAGTAAVAAIDDWSADAGFDGPEAQLFAFHELGTSPAIGWRPGSKRIVLWFGDSPGHDPICTAISGLAADVTEQLAIDDLLAGGPGGIAVLAASFDSGFGLGLNGDPTVGISDYAPYCRIGGTSGQAQRIAVATGGESLVIPSTLQAAETVFASLSLFLRQVRVTLVPSATIAPFVTSVSPAFVDVQIPASPSSQIQVSFQVTFAANVCTENQNVFVGDLSAHFDGALAQQQEPLRVTVHQPMCDSLCLLLAGLQSLDLTLPSGWPGPPDQLHVDPLLLLPVTLDSIPAIPLPAHPAYLGLHVFTQVYMFNDFDFPWDPVKMSNGLDFEIGGGAAPFGSASGMSQWAVQPAALGGVIQVGFSIDGF